MWTFESGSSRRQDNEEPKVGKTYETSGEDERRRIKERR
jgi:hypothetical protein